MKTILQRKLISIFLFSVGAMAILKSILCILLIIFMCFLPGCEPNTNEEDVADNLPELIDSLFIPLANNDIISGNILIAKNGKVIAEKSYGYADREHNIFNDQESVFRIGSITKTFTATAIMLLYERDSLNLKDPVLKFLDNFPNGDKITIHHLLTHTSGLINFNYIKDYLSKSNQELSIKEVIDWFKNEQPLGQPGEKFHYSNSNYVILAYIIERVSNQPYERFVKENILDLLSMCNSGVDKNEKILMHRSQGYSRNDSGEICKAKYQSLQFGIGHGAMYSTTRDLLSFAQSFHSNTILRDSTIELMYGSFENEYGYGWSTEIENEKRIVSHGGAISGYMSMIKRYLDDSLTIITLYNTETLLEKEINKCLCEIVLNRKFKPVFKVLNFDTCIFFKEHMGTYTVDQNYFFKVFSQNGDVFVQETGFPKYQAQYLGEKRFFVQQMNAVVSFVKHPNEQKYEVIIYQGLWLWKGVKFN